MEVIEVEDKLQKKRIMDEVKAELKQKELQMKEVKIASKLSRIEQQKKQSQIQK